MTALRAIRSAPAPGVQLADLGRDQCRYPVTGFHARQHLFCAEVTTGDSPYCAEHRRIATAPREFGRGPGRYPGWYVEEDAS
jgi:hypothetical protein